MKGLVAVLLAGIVFTTISVPGLQVVSNPPIPPSWNQRPGESPTPSVKDNQPVEDTADRMRREQLVKLNEKRQEQAKAEAAKLLEIATELKQQVDSANSITLSANSAKSARDADEIIKLTKSIKSKLRPY